jgi:hypothetical protein
MKRTLAGCLDALMAISGSEYAQSSGTKEETKEAWTAAKDAGKAATNASKKTAKTVKKTVTGDAHATCVDGTRQAGKTEDAAAAACTSHGGVAKK